MKLRGMWHVFVGASLMAPIVLVSSCGGDSEGDSGTPDAAVDSNFDPDANADGARADGGAVVDGCAGDVCDDGGSLAPFGFRVTTLPTDLAALTSVWGSGPTDVWACGTSGYVFHWDGTQWDANRIGGSHTFFSVWGTGPHDVWVTSATAFMKHTKGWEGATTVWEDETVWISDAGSSNSPITRAMWGPDESTFYVAGMSMFDQPPGYHVRRAPPNKLTVTPLPFDSGWNAPVFFGVHGTSPTDVWLVGEMGMARHLGAPSADGGPTITNPNTGMKGIAYAVWARTPEDAWLVGENGSIRHWTRDDGLMSWTSVPSPTTRPLFAIWGRAADDIWAVGDHGVIVHYDGVSWTLGVTGFEQPNQPALLGVWGTDKGDVWVVGDGVALAREATK